MRRTAITNARRRVRAQGVGTVGPTVMWERVSQRLPSAKIVHVRSARLEDFDIAALYAALDEQRQARGLTWAGATREINRPEARPVLHPISVSSVTGTRNGRGGEGNIVLQMLLWLDRTPESFVPDHPAPSTPDKLLPQPPPDRRLRWDVPALHAALNEKRQERGMTWKQIADEIGGFTPAMLTGLAKARHIGFPRVMRLVIWLDRPAASFTVARVLRSP